MIKHCDKKTCFIAIVALFVFMYVYEYFVHAMLLKDLYAQTASLWRNVDEMKELMPWCILKYALLAIVFTCFFKKCRGTLLGCDTTTPLSTDAAACPTTTRCPVKSGGLCYGIAIGLIMGICAASAYVYLPIPGSLAIAWFFACLFKGIGIGVILGILYGNRGFEDKNV